MGGVRFMRCSDIRHELKESLTCREFADIIRHSDQHPGTFQVIATLHMKLEEHGTEEEKK